MIKKWLRRPRPATRGGPLGRRNPHPRVPVRGGLRRGSLAGIDPVRQWRTAQHRLRPRAFDRRAGDRDCRTRGLRRHASCGTAPARTASCARCLDVSAARTALGFESRVDLEDGLSTDGRLVPDDARGHGDSPGGSPAEGRRWATRARPSSRRWAEDCRHGSPQLAGRHSPQTARRRARRAHLHRHTRIRHRRHRSARPETEPAGMPASCNVHLMVTAQRDGTSCGR